MSPKPETAKVVSNEMTWIVAGLPELTAGKVVEIPSDRLAEVLKLQGVVQVTTPTATNAPKE